MLGTSGGLSVSRTGIEQEQLDPSNEGDSESAVELSTTAYRGTCPSRTYDVIYGGAVHAVRLDHGDIGSVQLQIRVGEEQLHDVIAGGDRYDGPLGYHCQPAY